MKHNFKIGDQVILKKDLIGFKSSPKKGDSVYIIGIPEIDMYIIHPIKESGTGWAIKRSDFLKFKVNDKVKIVGKSAGCTLEQASKRTGGGGRQWQFGNTGTIEEVFPDVDEEVDYIICGDYFMEKDLISLDEEYIEPKEEAEMYKKGNRALYVDYLREQSFSSYDGDDPTEQEENKFVTTMIKMGYSFRNKIRVDKEFINYFTQHDCFVKWLLGNEFIEKVEVFKPFTIEIKIDSPEKYWDLYQRVNVNIGSSFDNEVNKGNISKFGLNYDEVSKHLDKVKP